MPFEFPDLNADVRRLMIEEIRLDVREGRIHISNWLNADGQEQWIDLLEEAANNHDEAWLAGEIRSRGLLNSTYERKKQSGGTTMAQVPVSFPETLAEGEFNRFYMRGLCQLIVNEGGELVQIFRAKQVANPRSESQGQIGKLMSAGGLLNDLRTNIALDTILGLPTGPNSGLSIQRYAQV